MLYLKGLSSCLQYWFNWTYLSIISLMNHLLFIISYPWFQKVSFLYPSKFIHFDSKYYIKVDIGCFSFLSVEGGRLWVFPIQFQIVLLGLNKVALKLIPNSRWSICKVVRQCPSFSLWCCCRFLVLVDQLIQKTSFFPVLCCLESGSCRWFNGWLFDDSCYGIQCSLESLEVFHYRDL